MFHPDGSPWPVEESPLARAAFRGEPTRDSERIIRTSRLDKCVRVSVSKNGPGLPLEEDLNPFDAFVTSKSGDLGVGLAISTTIIKAHGGDLDAGPSPVGGATFRFSLPI